jgi:hypothetical protein
VGMVIAFSSLYRCTRRIKLIISSMTTNASYDLEDRWQACSVQVQLAERKRARPSRGRGRAGVVFGR